MKRILLGVALAAVVAAGCGSNSSDTGRVSVEIEASRGFVLTAAERSETAAYRFDVSLAIDMDMGFMAMHLGGDGPMTTGSFDGARMATTTDMAPMFAEIAEATGENFDLSMLGLTADDMVIETVSDGAVLYLHAPILGAGVAAELLGLNALADGWGRVDLSESPDLSAADVAALSGQAGMDPSNLFGLLDGIDAAVNDEGPSEVRGVPTTRLTATAGLLDALAAMSGIGAEQFADVAGASGDDEVLDVLAGQPVTLDIDIDAAGLVRRVAYDMDMGGLVSELAALEGAGDMGEVTMRYVLEVVFFDYDADIVVDVPAGAVDVTDAFLGLVSTGV